MLGIVTVLTILIVMTMAKARPKRRRRMGRYIRGNLLVTIAGGTLAGATAITVQTTDQVVERTLVSSIVARYSLSGYTGGDNIGPVEVGVAHGDYTLLEIEQYLESSLSWDEGDKITRERMKRQVRRIGVFEVAAGSAGEASVLNDGKPIKTRLNWILNAAQGLQFWIYNQGTAAFATTDPDVRVSGHANLWPR